MTDIVENMIQNNIYGNTEHLLSSLYLTHTMINALFALIHLVIIHAPEEDTVNR